ncbi:FecR family protein [Pedobacter insulae]|uniref:FecR protein n=1 Tax=Pedobacter insulae TaxID=414048 RepID=A0A1I2ZXZ9_9SPHI|nr:FecR family protein [Pedobacter insulae]SFH42648.1 FecR protein [Pedobacter insulae]
MKKQDIRSILERVSTGQGNADDEAVAKYWLHQLHQDDDAGHMAEELEEISTQMWESIVPPKIERRTAKLWPRWAAAAAVVIAVISGGYFYYRSQTSDTKSVAVYANDIAPGKNGATLTLANGQKIYVSDEKAGKLAEESGVSISKTADGQIIYEIASSPLSPRNDAVQYNTLSTTRGEQFQVRLPDGTLVFLNAESSLKYPTSFAKLDQRQVTLTGEGYFEVAKDKAHPFIVKTTAQEVEVLGTHFNVNAYINEPSIKTTLVEGSVRLRTVNNQQVILKPNEQGTVVSNDLKVSKIDIEPVIAWKNNKFFFEEVDITYIMRMVSRWYDVEVEYQGEIPKSKFAGSVSRYENISEVLKPLESTGKVNFKIQGRRIVVTK